MSFRQCKLPNHCHPTDQARHTGELMKQCYDYSIPEPWVCIYCYDENKTMVWVLTALQGHRAGLYIHGVFLEAHLTGNETVDPGTIAQRVVAVDGEGGVHGGEGCDRWRKENRQWLNVELPTLHIAFRVLTIFTTFKNCSTSYYVLWSSMIECES